MPIFVSRFSPARVAGANLRFSRASGGAEEVRSRDVSRNPPGEVVPEGRVLSELRDLLVRSQAGDSLLARLREETAGQPGSQPPDDAADAPGRVLPGVGAIRSRDDGPVERIGRLGQDPASPVLAAQLDRFERLRAAGQADGAEENGARPQFPEARPQTPGLNRDLDARIRLLAAGNRSGAFAGLRVEGAAFSAEEISRANTTPEIRENLREDAREVGRGLRRDADRQAAQTTRETARTAGRAAEGRREDRVVSNRTEIRELRREERQIEREIRRLETENGRLRGPATRSTTTTAAGLGRRVDLLIA